MAYEDLKRVINQVRPTPEQEDAMLAALLNEERKGATMKTGRKMPRLAAAGLAAAILTATCAAAMVTGLDGRLLSYFGGTPETEGLLSPAAMVVDQEKTSKGATLHLRQIIADRYSAVALLELTAPEGTVLDGEHYVLDTDVKATAPDGSCLNAHGSGWSLLEDEAPDDGRISLMLTLRTLDQDFSFLGSKLSLELDGLYSENLCENLLLPGKWKFTVTLPGEDPGVYTALDAPLDVGGGQATLTSLYVSPISLAWGVEGGNGGAEPIPMEAIHSREDWPEQVHLTTAAGDTIPVKKVNFLHTQHKTDLQDKERGYYSFSLRSIIDPADIVSVSIFGQDFQITE